MGESAVAARSTEPELLSGLAPEDAFWALWRDPDPLPKPEPALFDFAECKRRFKRIGRGLYPLQWRWEKAEISPSMVPFEAAFWLLVSEAAGRWRWQRLPPEKLVEPILEQDCVDTALSTEDELLRRVSRVLSQGAHTLAVFANLFQNPASHTPTLIEAAGRGRRWWVSRWRHPRVAESLAVGLRRYLVPYLDRGTRERLREAAAAIRLDHRALNPKNSYRPLWGELAAAAAMGAHDQCRDALRRLPNSHYRRGPTHSQKPQFVVLGLGSAEEIESEMHRLSLRIESADQMRGWLATTGRRGLAHAGESVKRASNKTDCRSLLEPLARVRVSEAAPILLDIRLNARAPGAATDWLQSQTELAVPGLIPIASRQGKLAEAAVDLLNAARSSGHGNLVERAAGGTAIEERLIESGGAEHERFEPANTPEWLAKLTGGKAQRRPAWVRLSGLPPVVVSPQGLALNDEQIAALLNALSKSEPGSPMPLVTALRERAGPGSADTFAWALFGQWLDHGGDPKQKWAMGSLALLGGDACAKRLAPLIRSWPGDGHHQRAAHGLACLRAIGSDAALAGLSWIADTARYKAIKAKAAKTLQEAADERGLSAAQLGDRIVPDAGLGNEGGLWLDLGPRRFEVIIGEGARPMVRGDDGKIRKELPKPNAKDDADLAAAAARQWKEIKAELRPILRRQSARLTDEMNSGRRWTVEEFENHVLGHPILGAMIAGLVLRAWDGDGVPKGEFRTGEDNTLLDHSGRPHPLQSFAEIGIVHVTQLDPETLAAWREQLDGAGLTAPFEQLQRAVVAPRIDPRRGETLIANFAGRELPEITLMRKLEAHGWLRGTPLDAGLFHEHYRPFRSAGITAVQPHGGVPIVGADSRRKVKLEPLYFVRGDEVAPAKQAFPVNEISEALVSECLAEIGAAVEG